MPAPDAPASDLPLNTRFRLGQVITAEQQAFFDTHGFLVFDRVASADEIAMIEAEVEGIQERWLAEGRKKVFGIPLFAGVDPDGAPYISRFAFASMFSDRLRSFVLGPRFEPIRRMVGEDARVGHDEKDGMVINRYVNVPGSGYRSLGWHTDGLRDLAYLRMPQAMFNVGLHLDKVTAQDGGLRLIPGTHRQGFFKMCFAKGYFWDHRPDPREVAVETEPGDLTVHDGRLWHRVQQSPKTGWESLRRSIYVPYQTGPHEPKSEASKTPIYHSFGAATRSLRRWSKTRRRSG